MALLFAVLPASASRLRQPREIGRSSSHPALSASSHSPRFMIGRSAPDNCWSADTFSSPPCVAAARPASSERYAREAERRFSTQGGIQVAGQQLRDRKFLSCSL